MALAPGRSLRSPYVTSTNSLAAVPPDKLPADAANHGPWMLVVRDAVEASPVGVEHAHPLAVRDQVRGPHLRPALPQVDVVARQARRALRGRRVDGVEIVAARRAGEEDLHIV